MLRLPTTHSQYRCQHASKLEIARARLSDPERRVTVVKCSQTERIPY